MTGEQAGVALRIKAPGQPVDALVAADVIDRHGRSVLRRAVPVDREVRLSLEPGDYLLRIWPPRGPLWEGELTVTATGPDDAVVVSLEDDWRAVAEPEDEAAWEALDGVWLQLWALAEGWETIPWPERLPRPTAGTRLVLPLPLGRLHALQLGGRHVAPRVLLLPPAREVEVLVIPGGTRFDGGVTVRARSRSGPAEALLGYLDRGLIEPARVIAPVVVDAVTSAALVGVDGLMPAVAAGYFLLRSPGAPDLPAWLPVLPAQAGWLPDAAVVFAEALVRSEPERAAAPVRPLLLQAARRGPPVYRDGLRLVVDGLRTLAAMAPEDAEVGDALASIERYAAAADWRRPLVGFRGRSPARPGLTPADAPTELSARADAPPVRLTVARRRHVRAQLVEAPGGTLAAERTVTVTSRHGAYLDFSIAPADAPADAEAVAEVRVLLGGRVPKLYQRSGPQLRYGRERAVLSRSVADPTRLDAEVGDDLRGHLETSLQLE